jgi:hypothetical protein
MRMTKLALNKWIVSVTALVALIALGFSFWSIRQPAKAERPPIRTGQDLKSDLPGTRTP